MSCEQSRRPIAIIGGGTATPDQYAVAEEIGRRLAEAGWSIICGGRTGVMEAVCKGAAMAGGTAIALLPSLDAASANQYATVVLPTDLGAHADPIAAIAGEHRPHDVSRNRVIVSAAAAVIAVGGAAGTANEIKLARQFGRLVIRVAGTPDPEKPKPEEPALVGNMLDASSAEEAVRLVLAATTQDRDGANTH
jgi:predicted Rossmann-fold nucleotide-binding protein